MNIEFVTYCPHCKKEINQVRVLLDGGIIRLDFLCSQCGTHGNKYILGKPSMDKNKGKIA